MIKTWIGIVPALVIVHLSATSLFGLNGSGLAQMWEITPLQFVWLQTAFILAYAARFPIGVFAGRIASDRFVFLMSFVVSIVASGLFFLYANDFVWALVLRLIAGAAAGAMIYPALNMVTSRTRASNSIGLGLVVVLGWSVSIYVSMVVGQVNLGTIASFFPSGGGWNTIFLVSAIFGAVWLIPALFLLPRRTRY